MSTAHHDQLRAWASGRYPRMAATELLIRAVGGRFAASGQPWVLRDEDDGGYWIDFTRIPESLGGLSGGEKRLLMLTASIADVGVEVNVGDLLPGMDLPILELVLAAVAHAGGGESHATVVEHGDGTASLKIVPSPFPWPKQN